MPVTSPPNLTTAFTTLWVRVSAALAAFVLLAVVVAPAMAVTGPTRLTDPAVSPRTASPTTAISFGVTYRNREGSPPDFVRVVIAGVAHDMTPGADTWKAGVRFSFTTTLRAGTYEIAFQAQDRDKFFDELAAGSVTVQVPATPPPGSTPTPTAPPPPAPTPPPTTAPTAPPGPTPTPLPVQTQVPTGPTPTGDPNGGSSGGTTDPGSTPNAGAPRPSSEPDPALGGPDGGSTESPPAGPDERGQVPAIGGGSTNDGSGSGTPGSGPDRAPGPSDADPDGVGGLDPAAALADPPRAFSIALGTLGLDGGTLESLSGIQVAISTAGAVALWMGFLVFGKRRRDGEPPEPDAVLAANASRSAQAPASSKDAEGGTRQPVDPEAGIPRWRRQSLLHARKADPLREPVTAVANRTFASGEVLPDARRERRLIRYRVVRLLDAPDEFRAGEIGVLDQGDEVELVRRSGVYWLVRCPDGGEGWIHKMTLGEVSGAEPAPTAVETWGAGDGDQLDPAGDASLIGSFIAGRTGA